MRPLKDRMSALRAFWGSRLRLVTDMSALRALGGFSDLSPVTNHHPITGCNWAPP